MADALTFILKLQDMLTPGMRQAAGVSESSAAKIQSQFTKIEYSGKRMGASINELRERLDGINKIRMSTTIQKEFDDATASARRLERQINKLENKGRSGNGVLGGFGKTLLAGAGAAMVTSFVKDSIGASATFGATKESYGVLTGSKFKGSALADQLNQLQQDTILGPEVFKAGQTLMAFGVSADSVVKIEKQLGDVSMGNKDKFEALTLAFSQTQSAGRLMGQDLLQYINAGFNPLQTMSEHWKEFGLKTKMTVGQLKSAMEKGSISSAMVAKSFEIATGSGGKFNDMMGKMANTTYGKMQILQGQWDNFKIKVGNALDGVTNKAIGFATSLLNIISPQKTVAEQVDEQATKIYGLQLKLTSTNTSLSERKTILDQLTSINPEITKGIDAESIAYDKLATNINTVINALNKKRIAEALKDDNANVINEYTKFQQQLGKGVADVNIAMSKIGMMFPDLAARSDLSIGQKQMEAKRLLNQNIATGQAHKYSITTSGSGMGYGGQTIQGTKEGDLLSELNNAIKLTNISNAGINKLAPEFNKVQKGINSAMEGYNKIFGITPGSSNSNSSSGGITPDKTDLGKTKADSINQGGQRSIVINIGKQIEKLEQHIIGGGREAAEEIEGAVREAMRRVVYSMNGVAS